MVERIIALKDFKRAQVLWGCPTALSPGPSLLRTVWQIWNRTGRNFDVLVIKTARGSLTKIPVPVIDSADIDDLPEYQEVRLNVGEILE
jgi:hypothetical protein